MPVDYGYLANATSLNLIAKKLFLELGKMMNSKKTFTIAATMLKNCGIADINQHYDCIDIPNMGGFRFPPTSTLHAKSLFIGLIGIDEVILGRASFRSESHWAYNKPIIKEEVKKWESQIDKIKLIHVSTKSEKKQMMEYLKIPENKLHVIPLGVDHDVFKPTDDKEKTKRSILGKFLIKDNPYFIHISEINWARKNILRLFEAYKKARSLGIKQSLIVVGKNEPLVYQIAKEIPGIIMLGYVSEEDLVKLIQGSDGLLNPSLHEGFGLPILESMACKIPILTSNTFSPPEVVGNGGLLVDPYNVDDICKNILELSTNEKLRDSLSNEGYERSQIFSWKNTAEKLLELIEQYIPQNSNFNFDEEYDVAAYRTLVTLCEINIELRQAFFNDILKFDYSKIMNWSLGYGLESPQTKDFLIPLKEWLETKTSNQSNS